MLHSIAVTLKKIQPQTQAENLLVLSDGLDLTTTCDRRHIPASA
jgi:hypothetical protein